jgi:hypothetical protein
MKANELKQLIKEVARDVIKEEVAKEVNSAMIKLVAQLLKEHKSSKSTQAKRVVREEVVQEEPEAKRPVVNISTGNSKLDAVLAETAKNSTPLKKVSNGESLVELLGRFDKIGQSESPVITEQKQPENRMEYLKQIVGDATIENIPSALDEGVEVPDSLKKVFKTDFRALMRAMDKQKKSGGPGMIDTSRVLGG